MARLPVALGLRQDLRFDVTYTTEGMTRLDVSPLDAIPLTLRDISRTGFMATGAIGLKRGERLIVRLPHAGYRDAFAMWVEGDSTGFQFEKPLRPELFVAVLAALGYRPLPLASRRSEGHGQSREMHAA